MNFFEQFKKTWTNFSTGQKFSIIGIFAVVVLGLAVLPFVINSTEYGVLYSDLEQQEAGKIVEKLRESRIQYRLSGNSVMVPQDRVHELRLTMAMAGLPSSGVGFELFDKNAFGMTDFVQRLNYQRALQGELTRTISQLDGVEQARVHLALPEQSVFVDQEKKPTASVVLKLRSGAVMGKRQVDGIVHLVASSVEGMQPGGVTVVSSRGEVLFAGNGEEGDSFLTGNQYDLVQTVERYLEGKAQGMLDDFLGPRRAIVKVSVALNFDRIRTERETYDPDGVLRSEQTSNSTSGKSGENTSEETTSNYEVGKTVQNIVSAVGDIKRMTVAVVVDGSYTGGEDGGEKTYTPRSEEDLQKYEDLVKQSINFNPDRGDDIRVQNIPFDTSYKDEMKREMEDSEQKMAQKERKEFIITVAGKAIKVLIIVLIIFFALRTLRNIKPRVIMEQTMNMSGSTGGSTAPPGAGMNAGGAGSPDKAKEIADMLKKKWLS